MCSPFKSFRKHIQSVHKKYSSICLLSSVLQLTNVLLIQLNYTVSASCCTFILLMLLFKYIDLKIKTFRCVYCNVSIFTKNVLSLLKLRYFFTLAISFYNVYYIRFNLHYFYVYIKEFCKYLCKLMCFTVYKLLV